MHSMKDSPHTFQEVGLEVNLEDITTQTLDRVIKRKDVDSFSILDVETLMYIDKISKLHPQVVSSHFVKLNSSFFNVIRA